jgi:hypothetical protein
MNEKSRPKSLEEVVAEIDQNLQPDGPPVNHTAIALHVAGELGDEQARLVREQVVCWKAWNDAYWDTWTAYHNAPDSATPHDLEENVAEDVRKFVAGFLQSGEGTPVGVPHKERKQHRQSLFAVALALTIVVALGIVFWSNDGRNIAIIDKDRSVIITEDGNIVRSEGFSAAEQERIASLLLKRKYESNLVLTLTQELHDNPTMSGASP